MYTLHACSPVSASYAVTYPRTPYSAPPFPISTLPSAIRGAPVIAYASPCGVVCVKYPWLRGAYLELIAVFPPQRGRGLGADVIRWLEEEVPNSAPNLWTLVSSFNRRARDFYERQGFAAIGAIDDLVKPGYTEILLRKRIEGLP